MNARRLTNWLLSIIGVGVLSSCEFGSPEAHEGFSHDDLKAVAHEFVPASATDVMEADGIPWVQLNFKVTDDPGQSLFDSSRVAQARREGWHICQPANEVGSTFEDRTTSPPQLRSQAAIVLFRNGTLVIIADVIDSALPVAPGDANHQAPPSGFRQSMVITRSASEAEFEETARSLDA